MRCVYLSRGRCRCTLWVPIGLLSGLFVLCFGMGLYTTFTDSLSQALAWLFCMIFIGLLDLGLLLVHLVYNRKQRILVWRPIRSERVDSFSQPGGQDLKVSASRHDGVATPSQQVEGHSQPSYRSRQVPERLEMPESPEHHNNLPGMVAEQVV